MLRKYLEGKEAVEYLLANDGPYQGKAYERAISIINHLECFKARVSLGVECAQPELVVRAFKFCALQILSLKEMKEERFSYSAGRLLAASCQEVTKTEEYKELIRLANEMAAYKDNTLSAGNTLKVNDGSHDRNFPLLLQSFAIASGALVEEKYFSAAPVKLRNGDESGAAIIRPRDGPPIFTIGQYCLVYEDVQMALKALAPKL